MLTTKNYNFKKPELTDSPPDITVFNENFDDIDEKLFEALKTLKDFFANGGEIGGTITFPKGITRQTLQKINMRGKDYTQRSGLSNYNGYPTWATVIEDPDDDNNTNGLLFMLGSGSGDAYNDNYVRPLKMGYAQKNNIGSANVPWDDLFLRGSTKNVNGYTKLPNGFILQWGAVSVTGGVNGVEVVLPIAFNENYRLTVSPVDLSLGTTPITAWVTGKSNTQFWVRTTSKCSVQWMAIGW